MADQHITSVRKTVLENTICPSCCTPYDKGEHRKLIDTCGHEICYMCIKPDHCPPCLYHDFRLKNQLFPRSNCSGNPTAGQARHSDGSNTDDSRYSKSGDVGASTGASTEEEKKRLEEQQRREEEKRRQEELRKLEEQKRKEEELRKQEELRKIEEQKRLEEQRRLEELKRKEEERRQEVLRTLEELRRLEEKRKKDELQCSSSTNWEKSSAPAGNTSYGGHNADLYGSNQFHHIYERHPAFASREETSQSQAWMQLHMSQDAGIPTHRLITNGHFTANMPYARACAPEEIVQLISALPPKGGGGIGSHLLKMLETKNSGDIIIKVQGKEFPAHSWLLFGRSPILRSIHQQDTVKGKVVTMDDCDPATFKDFLTHIYTNRCDHITLDNVHSLLTAANNYGMRELKAACVEFLERNKP